MIKKPKTIKSADLIKDSLQRGEDVSQLLLAYLRIAMQDKRIGKDSYEQLLDGGREKVAEELAHAAWALGLGIRADRTKFAEFLQILN
jgi:hypothetical protein